MNWMFFSIITSVLLVVLLIILLIQSNHYRSNLREIQKGLQEISNGNLSYQIRLKNGILNSYMGVNKMLATWIYNTLKSSLLISEELRQISSSCTNSQNTVIGINKKVLNLSERAIQAHDRLSELVGYSQEITASEEELSAASAEALNNTKSAQSSIATSNSDIEKSIKILEDMNAHIQKLSGDVSNLSEFSGKVQAMADAINALSSNINLLALNASIEAARAGESGKGFAVVAKEVGQLAEQTSVYSKNIKSQIDDIKVSTDETVESMKDLISMSMEGKKSAASIKTYSDYINVVIDNTVKIVADFTNRINEQAEATQKIVLINENVSQFFQEFNKEVSQVVEDVKYQNELEVNNINRCSLMEKSTSNLVSLSVQFENIISNRLFEICKGFVNLMMEGSYDNEKLCSFAEKCGVSEFYITDSDGVTIYSNNPVCIGFRFSEDKDSQTYEFRRILEDKSLKVSQKFMKRDYDDKYYKFAALAREDAVGIVQAGVDLEDIINLKL